MSNVGARPRAPRPGVRPPSGRFLAWAAALLLGVAAPPPGGADEPAGGVAPPPPAPASPGSPPSPASPPAPRTPASAAPAAPADPLVVGAFDVTVASVVDGDTVRVPGEGSVRVLGLDCEEVFHAERDRAAAAADFAAYARAKRGAGPLPVKFPTPAGEAARDFVRAAFAGVSRVRLERDEVGGHERDAFGRRLAHVLLLTAQGERNLALEVLRAGHSPYFVKYGRSRRFDAAFAAAQREAREARRGLWGADGPAHYPDYEQRLAWWEERAQQVDAWRAAPLSEERIELGTAGAAERLAARVGQEAVVFGALAREGDGGPPYLLWLSDRRGADVPAVVFDAALWKALDHAALARRFVTLRGPVSRYRDRPQIEVTKVEQLSTR